MGEIEEQIASGVKVFIASAIARSDTPVPLHLSEIFHASIQFKDHAPRWAREVHEKLRADGRLQQVGNQFLVVPGVDTTAPPQTVLPTESTPTQPLPATPTAPETTVPTTTDPVSTSTTPPPLPPAATPPAPQKHPSTTPLPDESALLPFLASNKAIRVGSVSTMGQLTALFQRFHDTFSPLAPFRSWWKDVGEDVVQVMLDRLAHLQLVRVDDSSSMRKLVWDMNALGKHAPVLPPSPSTTASKSWTTVMVDRDLAQVKKSVLHQLKLFSFYRLQNIHQTMRAKYPPPQSFDLNAYVDHLVAAIEKDKRLVITEDDAGNPAFTWKDKSKNDLLKDPVVPNNRHLLESSAAATAATIAAALALDDTVPTSTIDAAQPSAVRDSKVWTDAVLAALWRDHNLRVEVHDAVVTRRHSDDSKKRARSPERRSATWDKDTADGVGQKGLYFDAKDPRDDDDTEDEEDVVARKKQRLHEVQLPVMEWYTPPLFELPSNVAVRPTVVESAEYTFQKQRALFIRDNVEVPYQQTPDLPTKTIALDYPY